MFIDKLEDYVVMLAYLVKRRNNTQAKFVLIDLHDRIDYCEQKILQLVSAQMDLDNSETMEKLIDSLEEKEGQSDYNLVDTMAGPGSQLCVHLLKRPPR